MKLGNLKVKLTETPTAGEHFTIELSNTPEKEFFAYNDHTETVKLRLSLETALLLAQFIDEQMDELVKKEMEANV